MKSPTSLKHLIRYAAASALLVANAVFPLPSFATVCDGGPDMSGVREKNGVLWVKGKFGQSASTADMGKTWSTDKKPAPDSDMLWNKLFASQPDSEVFWNRMFETKDNMYQNLQLGYDGSVHVITKKKDATLWKESPDNLILFGRGDQLFSFKGKLYISGMSVKLLHGEIYATASSKSQSDLHLEVSNSYLCKLSAESGACLNPYSWDSSTQALTGFFARENGNFFLSTSSSLLYFDAKADKWSSILPPSEWAMRCP